MLHTVDIFSLKYIKTKYIVNQKGFKDLSFCHNYGGMKQIVIVLSFILLNPNFLEAFRNNIVNNLVFFFRYNITRGRRVSQSQNV